MTKYLKIILILSLFGCHKNTTPYSFEKIKVDDHSVNEKQLNKTIRQLVESNKSDQAIRLLDSLIYLKKKNGFLYFERAYVKGYNFHHEAALKDYEIADKSHYNDSACQYMIKFTKQVLEETKGLNAKFK